MTSHPWEIRDLHAGTLVQLTHRDLDLDLASALVEQLCARALENGQAVVYLDLNHVDFLPSVVIGKLFTLARQLRAMHGQLYLCNLGSNLAQVLEAVGWPSSSISAPPRHDARS